MKARRGAPPAGRGRRLRPGLLPGQVGRAAVGGRRAALGARRDPRPRTRPRCGEALDLVEEHAAFTRTGTGGIAQVETNGLIAAAFEHWDSRAGDPNLHTHVAISSKVQGADGKWRALDARPLYRMTVAASEAYNTAFEAHLIGPARGHLHRPPRHRRRARAGPGDHRRADAAMIEFFSRRRAAIEARYAELVRELPGRARARPGRRASPPAGPAGQPGHPAGQEAAPLPGRQAGRVARGTDRAVRRRRRRPG